MNTADIVNAWEAHQATVQAAAAELAPLTPRQRNVLIMTCKGCTQKEIAKHLLMSAKTVENDIRALRTHTGLTIYEALVLATRAGWV